MDAHANDLASLHSSMCRSHKEKRHLREKERENLIFLPHPWMALSIITLNHDEKFFFYVFPFQPCKGM
jgi:hypothetical protein